MNEAKIRKIENAQKERLLSGPTSYNDTLRETLDRMTSLDDEVHELLDDSEYDADVQKCEKYIESAKHAIMRTSRQDGGHLVTSIRNVTITDAHEAAATTPPILPSTTISLPQSGPGKWVGRSGNLATLATSSDWR